MYGGLLYSYHLQGPTHLDAFQISDQWPSNQTHFTLKGPHTNTFSLRDKARMIT